MQKERSRDGFKFTLKFQAIVLNNVKNLSTYLNMCWPRWIFNLPAERERGRPRNLNILLNILAHFIPVF